MLGWSNSQLRKLYREIYFMCISENVHGVVVYVWGYLCCLQYKTHWRSVYFYCNTLFVIVTNTKQQCRAHHNIHINKFFLSLAIQQIKLNNPKLIIAVFQELTRFESSLGNSCIENLLYICVKYVWIIFHANAEFQEHSTNIYNC